MFGQISGQRLVATVDGWDIGHVIPFGHYVTSLGPVGTVRLKDISRLTIGPDSCISTINVVYVHSIFIVILE